MFDTEWRIAAVAFFCGEFCFFVSNSLIKISTNFIYFATKYFFFPCSSALIFHSFLTKLGKVPIFNQNLFANFFVCCSNNYLVRNRMFLSSTVTIAFTKGTCFPSCLDSITESTKSSVLDLILLFEFEILYYRIFGWFVI